MIPFAALVILFIGCALRLIYGQDIEFKSDEAYNFHLALQMGKTVSWSWVGMNSSADIANPGLSIWIFVLLAQLFSVQSPVELARAVQITNCMALAILLGFALSRKSNQEKTLWLWSAALAAVNPISIILQRKIWCQSVLPLFSLLFILAWFHRERKITGAFAWGFLGALLCQIHLSGFFFIGALVLWTILWDRFKKVRWTYWCLGSLLGALPLIPWFKIIWPSLSQHAHHYQWKQLLLFRFWNYWISHTFGVNISYSAGKHFLEFLRYPLWNHFPTYLVAGAHGILAICLIAVVFKFAHWKSFFQGTASETHFLVGSVLFGMGILITLLTIPIYYHYYLVIFPLQFVWLAQAALFHKKNGHKILSFITLSQFIISLNYLYFIHKNGGAPQGDYGVAYSHQIGQHRN